MQHLNSTVGYHLIEVGGTINILNGGFLFNDVVAELKHRSSMVLKYVLYTFQTHFDKPVLVEQPHH